MAVATIVGGAPIDPRNSPCQNRQLFAAVTTNYSDIRTNSCALGVER